MQKGPNLKNKKVKYNYEILESVEAGIVLLGDEVKPLKEGSASFNDSFAMIKEDEVWLINFYIHPYKFTSATSIIDPTRKRKLLLHKREIKKLKGKVKQQGFTLIPLRFYLNQNLIKVELGLCRGKTKYDKRENFKDKDFKKGIKQRY